MEYENTKTCRLCFGKALFERMASLCLCKKVNQAFFSICENDCGEMKCTCTCTVLSIINNNNIIVSSFPLKKSKVVFQRTLSPDLSVVVNENSWEILDFLSFSAVPRVFFNQSILFWLFLVSSWVNHANLH